MDEELKKIFDRHNSQIPDCDADRREATILAARNIFSQVSQETQNSDRLIHERAGFSPFLRRILEMSRQTLLSTKRGLLYSATSLTAVGAVAFFTFTGGPQSDLLVVPSPEGQSQADNTFQGMEPEIINIAPSAPKRAVELPQQISGSFQSRSAESSVALSSRMQELTAGSPPVPELMTAPMAVMEMDLAQPNQFADRETYAETDMSSVKRAAEEPLSTFSIDVDTASYALARSSLNSGYLPDPDAVRTEEFINYFSYDYPAPELGGPAPFSVNADVMQAPWQPENMILRIGIQGAEVTERKPLDLVFLVDTSGSMNSPDKLGLLRQSLKLALPQLQEGDRIGIVAYAGSAGTVLDMTDATDEATILTALNTLSAGGGTAGQAGLESAYAMAEAGVSGDRTSRVILATDGDFNVGIADPEALKRFISDKRDTGIYLSVLGFGRGNINDAVMQSLAQNGNGIAGYIDTLSEARKVLVDQFAAGAVPIANDVKIQVEFNPAVVQEYRLLGYETRALRNEDFNNDKVDAGEIGSGHSVTALYEITPSGASSALIDPLRYGQSAPVADADMSEIAQVKLRWKAPGESTSQLVTQIVENKIGDGDISTRFATAIAGYAQLLRGDLQLGDWTMADAAELAKSSQGEDPFGYRLEAIKLMQLAELLDR